MVQRPHLRKIRYRCRSLQFTVRTPNQRQGPNGQNVDSNSQHFSTTRRRVISDNPLANSGSGPTINLKDRDASISSAQSYASRNSRSLTVISIQKVLSSSKGLRVDRLSSTSEYSKPDIVFNRIQVNHMTKHQVEHFNRLLLLLYLSCVVASYISYSKISFTGSIQNGQQQSRYPTASSGGEISRRQSI